MNGKENQSSWERKEASAFSCRLVQDKWQALKNSCLVVIHVLSVYFSSLAHGGAREVFLAPAKRKKKGSIKEVGNVVLYRVMKMLLDMKLKHVTSDCQRQPALYRSLLLSPTAMTFPVPIGNLRTIPACMTLIHVQVHRARLGVRIFLLGVAKQRVAWSSRCWYHLQTCNCSQGCSSRTKVSRVDGELHRDTIARWDGRPWRTWPRRVPTFQTCSRLCSSWGCLSN